VEVEDSLGITTLEEMEEAVDAIQNAVANNK